MKKQQFKIRPMEKKDLSAAMDIKNREGWNQTLHDWEFLLYDRPEYAWWPIAGIK